MYRTKDGHEVTKLQKMGYEVIGVHTIRHPDGTATGEVEWEFNVENIPATDEGISEKNIEEGKEKRGPGRPRKE